jgi:hypothetical protein
MVVACNNDERRKSVSLCANDRGASPYRGMAHAARTDNESRDRVASASNRADRRVLSLNDYRDRLPEAPQDGEDARCEWPHDATCTPRSSKARGARSIVVFKAFCSNPSKANRIARKDGTVEDQSSSTDSRYDTPSSGKRRRSGNVFETPLLEAGTPSPMHLNTPPALDVSDDGYETPSEDLLGPVRCVDYSQVATTGFAPPEKCFAPRRQARRFAVLPSMVGLAATRSMYSS